MALAVTLFKEQKYQILTQDKVTVTITCSTDLDNHIFLKMIKQNIPWVHIGYTRDIEAIYKSGPKEFIKNLQNEGLHIPISSI